MVNHELGKAARLLEQIRRKWEQGDSTLHLVLDYMNAVAEEKVRDAVMNDDADKREKARVTAFSAMQFVALVKQPSIDQVRGLKQTP